MLFTSTTKHRAASVPIREAGKKNGGNPYFLVDLLWLRPTLILAKVHASISVLDYRVHL
jgi:hypothetical protein